MPAGSDDRPLDVTGRPLALRDLDLDPFFAPRRVVVIGASADDGRPNATMWRKLHAWGRVHGADVIPVNPSHREIDGARCYPSVDDVHGDIDVAAILVGDAVGMFETVTRRDPPPAYAVIFSAGFAETGSVGAA